MAYSLTLRRPVYCRVLKNGFSGKGMKKILLGVVVLGLVWVASSGLIGAHAEKAYREWLAGQEVFPSYDSVRFEMVEYHRSLFSSRLRICLYLDESEVMLHELSGMLCEESRLWHGPLLWTSSGPWLGLAYGRSQLDMQVLPEHVRSVVTGYTGGASLFTGESWWGFDERLRIRIEVPALEAVDDTHGFQLGEFVIWMDYDDWELNTGLTQLLISDLTLELGSRVLRVDGLNLVLAITDFVEGSLPLMEVTLHIEGMRAFTEAGGWGQQDNQVGFDLVFEGGTERHDKLMAAELRLWLDNIVGSEEGLVPADALYARSRVEGLDANAMLRLLEISDELNALQTEMMAAIFGSFGGDMDEVPELDVEALMADMERLSVERIRVAVEDVLRPGASALHLETLLDQGEARLLAFSSSLTYEGLEGENPALERFQEMGLEEIVSRMVDVELSLVLADLLPEGLREAALAGVEAGLLKQEADQFSMTLALRGGAGQLNGEAVTTEDLLARLPSPGGDSVTIQELALAGCFDEYDDVDDFPEVCWEHGLHPHY